MSSPLDLVQLRTLVAIADCGGFGRAASALHLSQPTVSQHVRALEKRIGAAIVEKDGRRTRLTEAGERLLAESRRILAVHDEALARLDAVAERPVVIGSAETTAGEVLPELLGALRAAFPGRPAQFRIDRSTRLEEQLERGELDVAVLLGVGQAPGAEVGRLHLDWYAAPGFVPRPRMLSLVAYVEPCGIRRLATQRLAAAGVQPEVVAESPTLDGVIAAARAGLGAAVLPTGATVPDGLVPVAGLPELGEATVRLVSRRGVDASVEQAAAAALLQFFGTEPLAGPTAAERAARAVRSAAEGPVSGPEAAPRSIATADRSASRIAVGRPVGAVVA